MDTTISEADAGRRFSELLRSVEYGESFTVTAEGVPVARIVPVEEAGDRAEAKRRLLARLRSQPAIDIGPWTRDELYDR